MGKGNYIRLILLTAVICIVPVVIRNQYIISILVFAGIYSIISIGLSLLMGYAGQISLGHAGFFAIGGYTSAILTKMHGWPPLTALLMGILISATAGFLVGIPALRLKGHYLAMATLGFGEIIYVIANSAVNLTEGPSGFSGVPNMACPGFTFKSELSKYILVWSLVFAILIFSLNIIHSRVGRAFKSIHGDETAANAMGVNVSFYKVQIFIFSAILASIAGSLYVHHMRFVSPSGFTTNKSILFLIMIMSGGLGSLWGAVIGAVLFTLLPEFLGVFEDYDILMYGTILLVMMMFIPEGITGYCAKVIRRVMSLLAKRTGSHYDTP